MVQDRGYWIGTNVHSISHKLWQALAFPGVYTLSPGVTESVTLPASEFAKLFWCGNVSILAYTPSAVLIPGGIRFRACCSILVRKTKNKEENEHF